MGRLRFIFRGRLFSHRDTKTPGEQIEIFSNGFTVSQEESGYYGKKNQPKNRGQWHLVFSA
jgi:hypothetical protein